MDLDENHYTLHFGCIYIYKERFFEILKRKWFLSVFLVKKLWRYDLHEIATAITRELYKI